MAEERRAALTSATDNKHGKEGAVLLGGLLRGERDMAQTREFITKQTTRHNRPLILTPWDKCFIPSERVNQKAL